MIRPLACGTLAAMLLLSGLPPARAADADLEALRADVAAARSRLEDEQRRLADLEARLAALEPSAAARPSAREPEPDADAIARALAADAAATTAQGPAATAASATDASAAAPAAGGTRLRLLDLSLSALGAAGGSTADDDELSWLQLGGHDPKQRGFTIQNVELSLAGAVDPYLRGEAHVLFLIDPEGETTVELEEAFLTTQALPRGVQLKAGQYLTDFGRLNVQHPHQWQFADQPVILGRLLGPDGLRGPGARISWLTSLPWYSELFAGVQQARGETAVSFLGTEELPPVGGHPPAERKVKSADDLAMSARWLNSVSLTDRTTLNVGASWAGGPNATGPETRSRLLGLDAYLKWTRASNERGFPFVAAQAEWLNRRYEAGAFTDDAGTDVPAETLRDEGYYAQVSWGFRPGWIVGARWERAHGSGAGWLDEPGDPLRDDRQRASLALTWLPTEFSKLRLQANHDVAQWLGDGPGDRGSETSLWLQWEFNLGAHGAHRF